MSTTPSKRPPGRPPTGHASPAERKAAERQRHKDAGRVPVTIHVLPEYREEVRALEAKLQRREKRS